MTSSITAGIVLQAVLWQIKKTAILFMRQAFLSVTVDMCDRQIVDWKTQVLSLIHI